MMWANQYPDKTGTFTNEEMGITETGMPIHSSNCLTFDDETDCTRCKWLRANHPEAFVENT